MTQILQVAPPQWLDTTLQLDPHTNKGAGGGRVDDTLTDRIRVARPFTAPIASTLTGDDDARVQAVADQMEGSFHAVVLDVTFEPAHEESFAKVWVATQLTAEPGARFESVAWSMEPRRSSHPVTVRDSVELSATPKGVGGKAARSEEFAREEAFVEALNVGFSNPTWVFATTRVAHVQGAHRLLLVVHSAEEYRTKGDVKLRAVIHRRRRLLGSYDVQLPDQPPLSFELSPATLADRRSPE